jgi:hypothetical protein
MKVEPLSLSFRIEGAVVFSEVKITKAENPEDERLELPEMNSEYKFAFIQEDDSFLYASKDGKTYAIALEVKLPSGEILSCTQIREALFE